MPNIIFMKYFRRRLFGYSKKDVDDYIAALELQYQKLQDNNFELKISSDHYKRSYKIASGHSSEKIHNHPLDQTR